MSGRSPTESRRRLRGERCGFDGYDGGFAISITRGDGEVGETVCAIGGVPRRDGAKTQKLLDQSELISKYVIFAALVFADDQGGTKSRFRVTHEDCDLFRAICNRNLIHRGTRASGE